MNTTLTSRTRRCTTVGAATLAVVGALLVGAPPAAAAGTTTGTVWTVGLGDDGQLGSGSTAHRAAFGAVAGLSQVVEVAGGREHVLARTASGQVYAWGDDSKGAVGDGGAAVDRTSPVLVLTGASQIATGHYHSLAVLTNGTVQSWGYNNFGQLGSGNLSNRTAPGPVTGLTGVASVTGGRDMSYALLTTGAIKAWGNNPNGELGDGTTTQRLTPVSVLGITNAVALAGGRNHGLALLPNGTIKAWGLNTYGQLGDGTRTNRLTPVTVSGITTAVAIGAGAEHSMAVLSDGRVLTWGRGYRGALGSGGTADRLVPGAVNGLPAIVSIDAGRDHTLAIAADGRLFSWGFDDEGQVGDGGTANRLSPYQVPGITNAVEAGGGRGYTVLLRSDGVTPPPDTTPPTVPGTPTATSTISGRVDLTWTASQDNVATTISYRVYRDGATTPITTLTSASTGQVTFADTGRTPGATHTYTVDASDGTNTSAKSDPSAPVTVAGTIPDTTPPTVPGTPTATSTISGRVDLTWTASQDNVATTISYRVYRDGATTPITTLTSASTGQVTFADTGRTPGATHTYTVDASDGTNTSAKSDPSAPVTVAGTIPDTTPPTVPGTPTATSTISGRVDLTWTASQDNVATTISYRVYRDGATTPITTLTSASTGQVTFADTGRTPGATHTYTVDASDGTNTSAKSSASAPVTVAGGGGGNVILTDDFTTFPAGFTSVTGLAVDSTRFAPGNSAPSVRAQPNNTTAFAYKDLPAPEAKVCAELAVRVESVSSTLALVKLRAGTTSLGRVSISAARALSVRADVTGVTYGTTATLALNTWNTVSLCVTTGAAGSIQLTVNGTAAGSWATNTGTAPITRVQLGDNDPKVAVYNLDALRVTR